MSRRKDVVDDSGVQAIRSARLIERIAVAAISGAIVLLAATGPSSADAKRESCGGKAATIVSNAKVIVGKKAPDVIVAGPGNNKIYGQGGNDTICGGAGDDTILGGRGSDKLLDGGPGNDYIDGERGKDRLAGGEGDDTLLGDRGSDDLDGGGGKDRVFGESGNDTVSGGGGANDFVDGGLGDDTVSGGGGDRDVVVGDTGNDKISGGGGANDIASYKTSTGPLVVNLADGKVGGAERERLSGIEDVIGGSGDDHIAGSPAPNRLDGGPGNDVIQANGSGDRAYGGAGSNDCIGDFASEDACGAAIGSSGTAVEMVSSIDGTGSLVVEGNGSDDRASLTHTGGAYLFSPMGGGNPVLLGSTDSGCERTAAGNVSCSGKVDNVLVTLGNGNDEFDIGDLPKGVGATVDGGKGSDTLRGSPSKDTLYGGDDRVADSLYGGGGDDALFGVNIAHPRKASGAGAMHGGPGNDLMIGGQPCGGDTFDGGPGANDSASFARVKNNGIFVVAHIGGSVSDPNIGNCDAGNITGSTEKIEGSTGPDHLYGDNSSNVLLGRGGNDSLHGLGGYDRCIGGGGNDSASSCEATASLRGS